MRKDYVTIDEAAATLEEVPFVEHYWADRWRDRGTPVDVSALARREEYRLIRSYLDRLPRGSRLLDGGCGMGEWTLFFAEQGFDVTGMDIGEETVARLTKWFPQHKFRRGDLRFTDFPDNAFDAYFSWGTFEHFECGLGECLIEAHRIVRAGGWLFISVPFQNLRLLLRDTRALEHWDESFDPQVGYRQPHRFYQWRLTRSELHREIELRGFRVHRITPIGKLTGAGRMLQHDLPLFAKGSRSYYAACRVLATIAPAGFISHMILAVAERR